MAGRWPMECRRNVNVLTRIHDLDPLDAGILVNAICPNMIEKNSAEFDG